MLFRFVGFVALASLLAISLGQAVARSAAEKTDQTDCRIEDWRWAYSNVMEALTVEGAVTCSDGHFIMRAYTEKEDGVVYLGNARSRVAGYAFTAIVTDVKDRPDSLSIKYTIEQRE